MKYQITHLKAPWPSGAVVGDVVDLPAVPVWAVGKCRQAADDAEVTREFDATIAGDGSGTALPTIDAINAQVAELTEAHAAEIKQLRADIESGGLALQAALTENAALKDEVAELKRAQEATPADEGKASQAKGKPGKA